MLLDQYGKRLVTDSQERDIASHPLVARLQRKIKGMLQARYDAAQTTSGNENHWAHTDLLDPHTANSLPVRRKLRVRSRYEVIENNPYLKGCVLTVANDFTGSGPKMQIIEKGWDDTARREVEAKFSFWWNACNLTTKLWRLRVAKLVDGEGFWFAYSTTRRKLEYRDCPVTLDMFPVEGDRVSSPYGLNAFSSEQVNKLVIQADGVKWDKYENPLAYNLLPYHPGSTLFPVSPVLENWCNADNVIHWFKQERGWLRGIPELTPSLPLCSMLRRYTLAVVQAAEIAADFSAVIESEGPPFGQHFPDKDDPFDTIPMERGMILRLPWGYKMSQLRAEQPIQVYDMFVSSILREICRPIGVPFNLAVGSSAQSNMASAIVDAHIYRGGQGNERIHCNDHVLDILFCMWYLEASLLPGYLPRGIKNEYTFPQRHWRFDRVGLDHTDPQAVQNAIATANERGYLTDRDIQEQYYNRDVEDWRAEIEADLEFREKVGLFQSPQDAQAAQADAALEQAKQVAKSKPKPSSK